MHINQLYLQNKKPPNWRFRFGVGVGQVKRFTSQDLLCCSSAAKLRSGEAACVSSKSFSRPLPENTNKDQEAYRCHLGVALLGFFRQRRPVAPKTRSFSNLYGSCHGFFAAQIQA